MSEKDEIIREASDYLAYNEIPKGKPGEAEELIEEEEKDTL